MSINWRQGLSDDQLQAAEHIGGHARLLAGPGTGKTKTLTHRSLMLILERAVEPSKILCVTFTRVAAFHLRQELRTNLEPLSRDLPRVSTLHSFALRQLLRNTTRIDALPQPLRIADDWEERRIILEDLKDILAQDIKKVRKLFHMLSADWETLKADQPQWEPTFPDAAFLGAWRAHRTTFGYTLRAELVYQLKRALNQYGDFQLESRFQHILIDEYQDLNACDLAVVKELAARGCELYVAGDDDQSIYGFRGADPTGIRRFPNDFPGARELELKICHRCDRSILKISEFVANLDPNRLPKPTQPGESAGEVQVRLLRFRNQEKEAAGIAGLCRDLIQAGQVDASKILILVRSDHNGAISSLIKGGLESAGVPVAERREKGPLDEDGGRLVLASLRLLVNQADDLAWRTALRLSGLGAASLAAIRKRGESEGRRFFQALEAIVQDPASAPHVGERIATRFNAIQSLLQRVKEAEHTLQDQIRRAVAELIQEQSERNEIEAFLLGVASEVEADSLEALLTALTVSMGAAEQELAPGAVNVMTMHKAKGLTADVVFIAGCEDEFIPGRNEGAKEGDERRLLYVSMTRARHRLFMTYCERRTGQQKHLGRAGGRAARRLTRFLQDAPIRAEILGQLL